MRREWFKRPTRMVHKFGETEKINDPLNTQTFEPPILPSVVDTFAERQQTKREAQQFGEHELFNPARSPVQTPSGRFASFNGPAPDWAEGIAAPVPTSTKKRVGHLKTDK